jgi:hypothetical protein
LAVPDLQFPDLPAEPLATIWAAIKDLLRADRNLSIVRTMRLWEGDPDDAYPPTASDMPFVRVTPIGSPMRKGDEASWYVEFTFKYELAVEGTSIVNLLRLFGAFRGAFNYNATVNTSTAAQVLRDAGAVVQAFRTAAIGPLGVADVRAEATAAGLPIQNLASVGTFVVVVYVSALS